MPEQVSSLTILRQIFLIFTGLLFIFAIVLNILMRVPSEHYYCMTHDKHIPDEEYLSAVITFLEQRYRMDNPGIKNEMEKKGFQQTKHQLWIFVKNIFDANGMGSLLIQSIGEKGFSPQEAVFLVSQFVGCARLRLRFCWYR